MRTVGSDAEKSSVSEYQKQKDIETSRKLCSDLDKVYDSLKSEGITIHDVMRKEPGQEEIDILVDSSQPKPKHTGTSKLLHKEAEQ